jgi:hypothetical protein
VIKRTPQFLLLLLLLCAKTALSQGTFTAISSGSWNTSGSWSHTGVDGDNIPDANDTATIPSGITINMTGGTIYQIASLTIQNGGTLNMNNATAALDIFPNGGVLQVDLGGAIANSTADDDSDINFMNNASFIINGIVQADRLEFEGSGQTVNITGSGTLLVRRFNVNNSNVTVNLNTTGSFGSNPNPFTIDMANLTINGTGTIALGGGGDLNIQAAGLSIGCNMNISDDIAVISNSASLTITNGGTIDVGAEVRVGPTTNDGDDFTLTVNSGGVLNVGTSFEFNLGGGGGSGADGFTLNNSGTIDVDGGIDINSVTGAEFNNSGTFTLGGSVTNVVAATGAQFNNNANALFEVGGALDADMAHTFTATGNTVNYNGTAQTILATTYYNLSMSGSGAKTAAGNISLRGNWSRTGSATFIPGANTVTFSALVGTAAQSITATGGETFNNLTMNSAFATIPQVTFNNPVTVTNTLNLQSGVVNLNGNQLTLGASGAASDLDRTASTTTNWVYGGAFRRFWPTGQTPTATTGNLYGLFPLGHSTASSYRPVGITASSNITTTGTVTFTHVHATGVTDVTPYDDDPTAGVINIVRKHNSQFIGAVSGVAGGTNYTVSVTTNGLAAGTASNIRLAVSNGASTVTNVGAHVANSGTAPAPIVGRSGINSVASLANDFRITSIDVVATPLPVELISFTGEIDQGAIRLNWRTASELNNDFFTVERSSGGEIFSNIGQVNGGGTSSHGNNYTLVDGNPIYGTAYYRLKQTDFDGTFTYSKIIDVTYEGSTTPIMDVFPNPSAGEELNIRISGLKNMESVPVVMYDQLGRECMRLLLDVDQNSGTASKTLKPEKTLPQGMYILKAGHSPTLTVRFLVTEK